jgi:hypothetical protein
LANPTTNYGFVLPTSSDLVTDLPADFDVALQGVDTRLKALQPGTTLGDLAYSSATANTNTRLAIGSTSQVLTVTGGVPVWATPAVPSTAKNYSLLNAGGTAMTGADTITVSSLSGYDSFYVFVSGASPTSSSNMTVRFNGDTGANYSAYGTQLYLYPSYNANNLLPVNSSGDTSIRCAWWSTNAASQMSGGLTISGANTSGAKMITSNFASSASGGDTQSSFTLQGIYSGTSVISSISFISGGGNFDNGTIFVYGSA